MGIMLSGGIDSSLLANYLASDKGRPEKIKSYSIKYLDKIKSKILFMQKTWREI